MERRDWTVLGLFVATVLATVAIVAVVVARSRDTRPVNTSSTPVEPRCTVARGVLPEWARTGFSEPEPRIAHVIGRRGELAAILFGDPLTDPPREDRSNKILWVARRTPPPGPLRLVAEDGNRTVRRVVEDGPGPSGVDLPAGCWTITARWPGGEDVLELGYAAG
jgi:hypothetical protein